MRKKILLLLILYLLGCNQNSHCIKKEVEELKEHTGYDYYGFVADFENYLKRNNYIYKGDIDDYIDFLEKRKYCDLTFSEINKYVNTDFNVAPSIGGAYIACGLSKREYIVDFDHIARNPSRELIKLLEKLTNNEFDKVHIKAFFIYYINVLIDHCEE